MIEVMFIIAFIVLFLHVCTWEGMIFSFVSKGLKNLPDAIKKPLYDCPICMTIWWGSVFIWIAAYFDIWHLRNIVEEIFVLFAAAGMNTVFIYIVDAGKAIAKTLGEYECNCTKKEDKEIERKERLAKATAQLTIATGIDL